MEEQVDAGNLKTGRTHSVREKRDAFHIEGSQMAEARRCFGTGLTSDLRRKAAEDFLFKWLINLSCNVP